MATAHCSHSDLEGEQKDMESVRFGGQRSMSKFKAVTRELQRKQLWLVKRGAPLTRNWGNSNCAQRSRPPPLKALLQIHLKKERPNRMPQREIPSQKNKLQEGFPQGGHTEATRLSSKGKAASPASSKAQRHHSCGPGFEASQEGKGEQ